MKKGNQGLQIGCRNKTKVYRWDGEKGPRFKGEERESRLDKEREPRFAGCRKKKNQGLHVGWRKKNKVFRLDGEREPRLTGWMKK